MSARSISQLYVQASKRVDPTQTLMLRKAFERDIVRRFRKVQAKIKRRIVDNPMLVTPSPATVWVPTLRTNADFDFRTSTGKVAEFMQWLRDQQDADIFEVRQGTARQVTADRAWTTTYVRSAYQKGLASAARAMRAAGTDVADTWVQDAFYRPVHADRSALAYTRAYSDLGGITDAMDSRISRTLANSMVEGLGAAEIAREIDDVVEGIGITRARLLARTETIRAHAEGALNGYEEAEIEGVEVDAEISTADDNKVCEQCKELEGQVYSISEARGLIPVHPNCRCAWLPVVKSPHRSLR